MRQSNLEQMLASIEEEEGTATLEKDFFLNLLFVLLFLIGQQPLVAGGRTAEKPASPAPMRAVHLFVEDDGDVHFDSLSSAHVPLEQVADRLTQISKAETWEGSMSVLIHHEAHTPAGVVHRLLRAVSQVPDTEPLLALSQYGPLPCETEQ